MPKVTHQLLLAWLGYVAFFVTCFVLAAYVTFPYERVRDLVQSKGTSAGMGGSPPTKLTIGELGPHWLTGVTMHSVVMERASSTAGEAPTRVELSRLTVSVSPFAVLMGGMKAHFSGEIGAGSFDGTYQASKQGPVHLDAELDAVDLGRLGTAGFLGVPIKGAISGTIDATVSDKPVETEGSVELTVSGLKLGDGKSQVKLPGMPGGLTLETIDAGKLQLKVTIKEGVATIEKLEAKGKDLELSGSGSLRLVLPVGLSHPDITLGAKFEDGYKHRNDRTKTIFDLIDMNPLIKSATGGDGMMRFKITGTLNMPRSAPATGGSVGSGGKPRRRG